MKPPTAVHFTGELWGFSTRMGTPLNICVVSITESAIQTRRESVSMRMNCILFTNNRCIFSSSVDSNVCDIKLFGLSFGNFVLSDPQRHSTQMTVL